jgi:hypothetical protein
MSEIFPTRIREIGIAVGTATQWLFNFVFSQATPHAVDNMGWKTFLMFCIFNWAIVVYVFFFIKETTGKSLEEMEDGMSIFLSYSGLSLVVYLLIVAVFNSNLVHFRKDEEHVHVDADADAAVVSPRKV